MSTGKRVVLLFCAFALLVALAWWMATYHEHQDLNSLRGALSSIQLAVERYAVDTEGVYPLDLEQLLARGYIDELPDSPYGGKVQLLRPGEPARPGGVLYLPAGPVVLNSYTRLEELANPAYTTEIDRYTLIIYQAKPGSSERLQGWSAEGNFSDLAGSGVTWQDVEASIDRRRIALVLDSGTQYSGDR